MSPRVLVVLAALAAASPARADVVASPPARCPHGGVPVSSHGGPHCSARPCPGLACPAGSSCGEVEVCVAALECGGQMPRTCEEVVGPCRDGGGCARGSCRRLRTCVPSPWWRGGCAVGGRGRLALGALLAAAGLFVLLHRRSR